MTTIFKMLDVSTGHVQRETDKALDISTSILYEKLIVQPWFDSGWIICVPGPDDGGVLATLALTGHSTLARILLHARKLGCHYIKLDADGEVIDGFETYNW